MNFIGIELVLENNGKSKTIRFPSSEFEINETCEILSLHSGQAFVRTVIEPKAFADFENMFIDFDEMNYLAKRMESFTNEEVARLYAIKEISNHTTIKDLINATFNGNCYTLITDVSDLRKIGLRCELDRNGGISTVELEKKDLAKLGRNLLLFGNGIPTSYGLLFRNPDIVFEQVYNGDGFPAYYYDSDVVGVRIEKDGKENYLYFPCEEIAIDKAIKRIGAKDITDCRTTIDLCDFGTEWQEYFEERLNQGGAYKVNELLNAVLEKDELCDGMNKLSAVMRYAETEGIEDLSKIAEKLECFGYVPQCADLETVGKKLVKNDYDISQELDKYIDYIRYAQDFISEHNGKIVDERCLVYMEDGMTLQDVFDENEIKLGEI